MGDTSVSDPPVPIVDPTGLPNSTLSSTSTTSSQLAAVEGQELPPSDLELDDRSNELLHALLKQSFGSAAQLESTWTDPCLLVLSDLAKSLTPELISLVAEASIALWKASQETARANASGGGGKSKRAAGKEKEREKDKDKDKKGKDKGPVLSEQERKDQDKDAQRARWRAARQLLRPRESPQASGGTSIITADLTSDSSDGLNSDAKKEATWTAVEDHPKLSIFRLTLATHETTLGAVKAGTAKLGLEYEPGKFEGRSLFGKDRLQEIDEDDLNDLGLLGGTFRLTCTHKETTKLERILELLSFATLSLKLEAHLLRDVSCPRPPLLPDSASLADSETATPTETQQDRLEELPSEDWQAKKKGHKSRWSRGNLWGFLLGSSSSSSSATPSPKSSPEIPSSPLSPKVKNKLKHFGDGLRIRRTRSKRREGSEGSSRGPSVDLESLDAWDFVGGLGLGIENLRGLNESEESGEQVETVKEKKSEEEEPIERFQKVIKAMEQCILSVSPNVVYPPPHLLVRLRQQELEQTTQSTASPTPPSEPQSPSSLFRPSMARHRSFPTIDAQTLALGFASGGVMPELDAATTGTLSSINSTTSRATRITLDARAGLASLMTNNNSLGGTTRHQGMQFLVERSCKSPAESTLPCQSPEWLAYSYFDNGVEAEPSLHRDLALGELVERLVESKDTICDAPHCSHTGVDHVQHFMHNKSQISVSVFNIPEADEAESELSEAGVEASFSLDPSHPRIVLFTTCKTCGKSTPMTLMSAATYLFSFAKLCELMLYDPDFVPVPEMCEHAAEDRNTLVRNFALGKTIISITSDPIELFELRLPTAVDPDIDHEAQASGSKSSASVDSLKEEISTFYQDVYTYLDDLSNFIETHSPSPPPTTPAEDLDANHSRTSSEATINEGTGQGLTIKEFDATIMAQQDTLRPVDTKSPLPLLVKLRNGIEDDEADLLQAVNEECSQNLNNGRWYFLARASGVKRRVAEWKKKHCSNLPTTESPPAAHYREPEYFDDGTHVFPVQSSILVREKELSSAIALTLSVKSFQDQVSSPTPATSRKVTPQSFYGTPSPATSRKSSRQPIPVDLFDPKPPPSPHLAVASFEASPPKNPRPPPTPSKSTQLDPDDLTADFGPVEDYECVAKPKKDGKTGGSIIRGMGHLVRQPSSESFGFFRSPLATPTGEGPQLGEANRPQLTDDMLEKLVDTTEVPPSPRLPASPGTERAVPQIISTLTKRHVSDATTSSHLSVAEADMTQGHGTLDGKGSISSLASLKSSTSSTHSTQSAPVEINAPSEQDDDEDDLGPLDPPERVGGGSKFLSGLWSIPGSIRWSPKLGAPVQGPGHVKFKFRRGEKAFRVTAYYAARFQALRARCGLSESLFIDSLSRCEDLNPSGGKSKSAFWMTADKRFILKELVTAWGVSEREAFLSFAPQLLSYLMAPERPSLLAKIFGFYTIKTKNLKTGETKKLDIVVMEHLFHSQTITRTFDLKGVASRVAKQKAGAEADDKSKESKTGWDGDWLSGSLKTRLLIYSHSKTMLMDALYNDSSFLSQCGNIDYSLLVGVDDSRKELVVGLIDTLGVFNTFKMLENAGKTVLKKATASDSESVTILPPSDYSKRFRQAMAKYFVAVPEKFSCGERDMESDPRLASVL